MSFDIVFLAVVFYTLYNLILLVSRHKSESGHKAVVESPVTEKHLTQSECSTECSSERNSPQFKKDTTDQGCQQQIITTKQATDSNHRLSLESQPCRDVIKEKLEQLFEAHGTVFTSATAILSQYKNKFGEEISRQTLTSVVETMSNVIETNSKGRMLQNITVDSQSVQRLREEVDAIGRPFSLGHLEGLIYTHLGIRTVEPLLLQSLRHLRVYSEYSGRLYPFSMKPYLVKYAEEVNARDVPEKDTIRTAAAAAPSSSERKNQSSISLPNVSQLNVTARPIRKSIGQVNWQTTAPPPNPHHGYRSAMAFQAVQSRMPPPSPPCTQNTHPQMTLSSVQNYHNTPSTSFPMPPHSYVLRPMFNHQPPAPPPVPGHGNRPTMLSHLAQTGPYGYNPEKNFLLAVSQMHQSHSYFFPRVHPAPTTTFPFNAATTGFPLDRLRIIERNCCNLLSSSKPDFYHVRSLKVGYKQAFGEDISENDLISATQNMPNVVFNKRDTVFNKYLLVNSAVTKELVNQLEIRMANISGPISKDQFIHFIRYFLRTSFVEINMLQNLQFLGLIEIRNDMVYPPTLARADTSNRAGKDRYVFQNRHLPKQSFAERNLSVNDVTERSSTTTVTPSSATESPRSGSFVQPAADEKANKNKITLAEGTAERQGESDSSTNSNSVPGPAHCGDVSSTHTSVEPTVSDTANHVIICNVIDTLNVYKRLRYPLELQEKFATVTGNAIRIPDHGRFIIALLESTRLRIDCDGNGGMVLVSMNDELEEN